MRMDDAIGYRKAPASTRTDGSRGEERFEDMRDILQTNADAIVSNFYKSGATCVAPAKNVMRGSESVRR